MQNKQNQVMVTTVEHHRMRMFFSSLFGFIGLNLIILTVLVIWLGTTITNTDRYVEAVTPLVNSPAVSDYVSDKVTQQLLGQVDSTLSNAGVNVEQSASLPVKEVASRLLPVGSYDGLTDKEIISRLEPVIRDTVASFIQSDSFETLWIDTNRSLHEKLVYGLTHSGSDIVIDLHPVVEGVMEQLQATKFAFLTEKIDVPNDVGLVTVDSMQLDAPRHIYNYIKIASLAMIIAAVVSVVLAVLISVNRSKTFRRMLIATALSSALFAVALSALPLLPTIGNNPQDTVLAKAVIGIVFADLRTIFIVITVALFVTAAVSKIIEVKASHHS